MGELPDQVTVPLGGELGMRLPSSASGGYRWQAAVDDPAVAEAITRLGDGAASSSQPAFPAFELLFLRGCSVGTTRVHCTQRRAWEAQLPPVAEQTVTVHVVAGPQQRHREKGHE
jgi:predicted secreted protein